MREYTYQDMLKMQEDAANRVREMKKRAAIAVEDDGLHEQPKPALPDEVKHISYPVELPENQQIVFHDEEKSSPAGVIDYLKNDKDAILILALLAVLNDGNEQDNLISLALLYLLL